MTTLDIAAFREAYSAFLRPGRVLLTGHSHQAWPDCAREAQARYFDDAARLVDDKWDDAVFPVADRVGKAILRRLGFAESDSIAFGQSTHELVYRLLSCLSPREKPRVVTTTSEFHSLYRQLSRLEEEGLDVRWVDARDRATLEERLCEAITPGTAMVAVSGVLFEDAYVLRRLSRVLDQAAKVGAIALVDAYHAFNVVPLELGPSGARAFVTAGGYKYAQFGEGLCFLRIPPGSQLRPVYTGWFADFAALARPRQQGPVGYGAGAERFFGSTFDGSALYRADAVLTHLERFGLGPAELRAISTRQTTLLIDELTRLGVFERGAQLASPRDPELRGGFVSIRVAGAQELSKALRGRGVLTDARGDHLRLGPAPYLLDEELTQGAAAVADLLTR